MRIAAINKIDYPEALQLVFNIFLEYEAPDYSTQGVDTFRKSVLENQEYQECLKMYGAFKDEVLVGVIATRNNGKHIALFFVDGKYHRQGIGRQLFSKVVEACKNSSITVNSSPYATEVYHHLGFVDTESEQITDGMRYTPMRYDK